MVFTRRQRRWVAWLALAGLWLAVVAPVISRTLGMVSAEACPVHLALAEAAHHHGHDHADPLDHLDACGYCTLSGHSPLLTGATVLWLGSAPPKLAPPPLWAMPDLRRPPLLSAHPRGPPPLA